MLLLLFGALRDDIALAIVEADDGVALRVIPGIAPIVDPNFCVVAHPRCRTIVPKSP